MSVNYSTRTRVSGPCGYPLDFCFKAKVGAEWAPRSGCRGSIYFLLMAFLLRFDFSSKVIAASPSPRAYLSFEDFRFFSLHPILPSCWALMLFPVSSFSSWIFFPPILPASDWWFGLFSKSLANASFWWLGFFSISFLKVFLWMSGSLIRAFFNPRQGPQFLHVFSYHQGLKNSSRTHSLVSGSRNNAKSPGSSGITPISSRDHFQGKNRLDFLWFSLSSISLKFKGQSSPHTSW